MAGKSRRRPEVRFGRGKFSEIYGKVYDRGKMLCGMVPMSGGDHDR